MSPQSFAQRALALLDDDLCAGMLGDPAFTIDHGASMVADAGAARGRALVHALSDAASGDVRLAWLAAGMAEGAGDASEARRIAADALGRAGTGPDAADAAMAVAQLAVRHERYDDALDVLDAWCARDPEHEQLQALRALAHELAAESGAAHAARARFADRSLLLRLRSAVTAFVDADPELARWHEEEVASFLAEARETAGLGPFDRFGDRGCLRLDATDAPWADDGTEVAAAIAIVAAERAWLSGPDEPGDSDLDDGSDQSALLARFAAAPDTPADLADAARGWLRHVRYGLWQPVPAHRTGQDGESGEPLAGTWFTDLVTRRQVYAAVPPAYLDGLPRWSVLAGALAPIGGVWHCGAAMVVLEPSVADRAADIALETADAVAYALAREHGIRVPRPRRSSRSAARPHGVLAALADPMEPTQADLTAKVLGTSLANLVGMVERSQRQVPVLANTDGDRLELLRATFPAPDPLGVRVRLLDHPDFEGDDDLPGSEGSGDGGQLAPPLRWLGREMSAAEAASSLAAAQAEARRRGWGPVPEPEGPRRWLRGILQFHPGRIVVELNSRPRLEALSALLGAAGAGPPEVQWLGDPAVDIAPRGGRLRGGHADDPEAEEAWRAAWLDEPVPALEGVSPRVAADIPRRRVQLESLLRQFEHDADLAAMEGRRPLDVARLRAELGMTGGVLGDDEPGADPSAGDDDPEEVDGLT